MTIKTRFLIRSEFELVATALDQAGFHKPRPEANADGGAFVITILYQYWESDEPGALQVIADTLGVQMYDNEDHEIGADRSELRGVL